MADRLAELQKCVKRGWGIKPPSFLGFFVYTAFDMIEALHVALEEVRKTLRLHQGGIDLVSWDEPSGELVLAFSGTCAHCALSSVTLKKGVEVVLCERVPAIQKIRVVERHAKDLC